MQEQDDKQQIIESSRIRTCCGLMQEQDDKQQKNKKLLIKSVVV